MKKKKAFSLTEIIISFIVLSVIAGSTVPIIFKKQINTKIKTKNQYTTKCDMLSSDCKLCKKNLLNSNYVCTVCPKTCGIGQFLVKEKCVCKTCADFNTKSPFSPSNPCSNCCVRCNIDFCTGCNLGVGLKTRNSKMGCEICRAGYYSDTKDDSACKACQAGYYQPLTRRTSASQCIECDRGYYCPTQATTQQKKCPRGTWQDNKKQTSCKDCPKGYKCPSEGMTAPTECGIGYYQSNTKQQSCIPCTNFRANTTTTIKVASSTTQCVCKAGYTLNNGACVKCAPNTYKAEAGNFACVSCPIGTTTNAVTGATSKSFCKCKKGYFGTNGGPICEACNAGTYQDLIGQTSCKNCTLGHYCPGIGAITPTECIRGTYQDKLGQASCIDCDYGYYQASWGQTSCKKCFDNSTTKYKGSTSVYACNCVSGYAESIIGEYCCKKITSNCQSGTTKVITDYYGCKAICVSNRNAGDPGGFGNLNGIELRAADYWASLQYTGLVTGYYLGDVVGIRRCWHGTTAFLPAAHQYSYTDSNGTIWTPLGLERSGCDGNDGAYDGCTRTVCTWDAAVDICRNIGWRLPTKDEANQMGEKYKELKFCHGKSTDDGGDEVDIPSIDGVSKCVGGYYCSYSYDGACSPTTIWTSDLNSANYNQATSYWLFRKNNTWFWTDHHRSQPGSVRCVYDLYD